MNAKGFTLLEALVATALLAILLTGVLPLFFVLLQSNTRNEERSGAVAAAQEVMEQLRQQDPATMPAEGAESPAVVNVGDRAFEVRNWYCLASQFCSDDSRHVLIEVNFGGRTVFSTESVYTQLR